MFDADSIKASDSPELFERNDDDTVVQRAATLILYAVALAEGKSEELAREIQGWTTLDGLPDRLPTLIVDDAWQLVDLAEYALEGLLDRDSAIRGQIGRQAAIASALADASVTFRARERVRETRDPYQAVGWIASYLWSADALLRAAAAASLAAVIPTAQFLAPILRVHASALDEVENALGDVGLRLLGHDTSAAFSTQSQPTPATPTSSGSSILLNGTFTGLCEPSDWFWPTGKLAKLVRSDVASDLYDDPETFFWWGGAFSTAARRAAAVHLDQWMKWRSLNELHMVIAHSHGGNVALDYLGEGKTIELLVLLHTPLIEREAEAWEEISSRVGRVLVLSTRFDWIVWLDRAGSRLDRRRPVLNHLESRIGDRALSLSGPIGQGWWSHSHFTKLQVWERHGIARLIDAKHRELH